MSFLARLLGRAGGPEEERAPQGDPLRVAEVEAVLAELAPLVALDGGLVELVAVGEEGEVTVALRGACKSCFAKPQTIEGVVAPRLRERLPWVTCVTLAG